MSITTTNFILKLIIVIWSLSAVRSIAIMFCGKLFVKASKGAKTAMYPILNLFGMLEVVEVSPFWGILLFMPGFNLIVLFMMSYKLAKVFRCGTGQMIGLMFLDIIFYPLLAKSDAGYKVTDTEYYRSLDSARNDSVHLMTQSEIDAVNKIEEETNLVDSIFKSEIEQLPEVEPYRASRNIVDLDKKDEPSETIGLVDDLFRPIERKDDFEQLNTSEEFGEDGKNKFTSELEREDKVEFFDL